jgi:predicted Zn-dependent protease
MDIAKGYYASLVTANQADANVFLSLSSILRKENNIDGALTTIIEGRKSFPENNPLMIEQLNIYLSTGREKEASEFIDMAIQSDPSNASLYFAKGTLNDKQGKKDVAEMAYKKAIELNGNYFEAYYNLGAMHFNTAAEMVNKANDIPPNKIADYEAAKKKFEAKFREAVPYLEKALELSPKDVSTMESLKQIYTKLNQLDKASEMKKRIEASK